MLSIYLGSLLFGGVLLGASIFGGHGDGDAHGGHDGDGHDGDGHDGGHGHDGHAHGDGHHHQVYLPFFSLRFWAFALAFFGLSGAALTVSGLGAITPFVAAGMGMGCGYVSARVLRGLTRGTVGLLGSADAHVGREGRVLLPVDRGRRGKIRLSIGGVSTDVVAETESDGLLAAGETALVVGMRGTVALVERSPASLPPLAGVPVASKREDS